MTRGCTIDNLTKCDGIVLYLLLTNNEWNVANGMGTCRIQVKFSARDLSYDLLLEYMYTVEKWRWLEIGLDVKFPKWWTPKELSTSSEFNIQHRLKLNVMNCRTRSELNVMKSRAKWLNWMCWIAGQNDWTKWQNGWNWLLNAAHIKNVLFYWECVNEWMHKVIVQI